MFKQGEKIGNNQEEGDNLINGIRARISKKWAGKDKLLKKINSLLDGYEASLEKEMLTPAEIKREFNELLLIRGGKKILTKANALFIKLMTLDLFGGGMIKLSDILYVQSSLNKKSFKLHLDIDLQWLKQNKLKKFKEEFEKGLKQLAKIIKDSKKIKFITMESEMVKKNPKKVKEAGFTISERGLKKFASMTREDFLSKYLTPEKKE